MKQFIVLMILIVVPCYARTTPAVSSVEGTVLHTMQTPWIIVETENSEDTEPNALGDTERTKKTVDRLIAANANNDGNMSTYILPSKWNGIRLRAIGITAGHTLTHQIYFGSLGGGDDCELTYAGQLVWVIGAQQSIYDQIAYDSGGPYEPQVGDIVTGNANDKTAVVVSKTLTGGTWASGDAAGTITYKSASGVFGSSSETIKIVNYLGVTQANVLTHTTSDLVDFELADTLVITSKAWGSSWAATSPVGDLSAEAEIDIKGADYMVIITTACASDGKLLIKGY